MIHNEDFLNMLDLTMMMFKLRGTPETFCEILETVFLGIREDLMIGIPDTGEDTQDPVPSSVRYDDGLESLILLTNLSEEAGAVKYPLRALAKALDRSGNCCGFVINPDKQNMHIPKGLIKAALGAGYQVAMNEIEEEAERMAKERRKNPKEIFETRPMAEDRFAAIEERIRAFEQNTEDFLRISFPHDEKIRALQIFRTEQPGKRYLGFVFDGEDPDRDKPLVLGKVLATDRALEIMKKVCVEGADPGVMKELEDFRKMS